MLFVAKPGVHTVGDSPLEDGHSERGGEGDGQETEDELGEMHSSKGLFDLDDFVDLWACEYSSDTNKSSLVTTHTSSSGKRVIRLLYTYVQIDLDR